MKNRSQRGIVIRGGGETEIKRKSKRKNEKRETMMMAKVNEENCMLT